jgi:hypothetical protein
MKSKYVFVGLSFFVLVLFLVLSLFFIGHPGKIEDRYQVMVSLFLYILVFSIVLIKVSLAAYILWRWAIHTYAEPAEDILRKELREVKRRNSQ